MTNIADIIDGCGSYPNESWALLLKRIMIETVPPPRRAYVSPAVRFLATLRIQEMTTSDAGIEKWGFTELLGRLSALQKDEILRIEEFDVKQFATRCVFKSDSRALLGCTIVKKRHKAMQTPPTWDGSLDALERFNNLPKE